MDLGVASWFEAIEESGSSMPYQIFIDFLTPDKHGWIRCQPPTVASPSYYDSPHMSDLKWKK